MEAVHEYDVNPLESPPDVDDHNMQFGGLVAKYKVASVGATTEEPQRRARLEALARALRLG